MDCDVIVIGAGPAGSSFAKTVAGKGFDVVVLDKKKDLGSPVRCGEGLGLHWFEQSGVSRTCGAIAAEIGGAAVYGPKGQRLVFRTPDTKGFVLERKIFDKMLCVEAARKGATFLPKTMVLDLINEDGKFVGVKALRDGKEEEYRAPLVVSAEGMEAKMARKAGFPAMATLYDVDSCYEYEMTGVECEDLIELYFGNSIAPRGYVWIFPKGKDVANVGIGVGGDSGVSPKKLLDGFIAGNARCKDAKVIEVKGGIISVGAPIRSFVKDNMMVIGTAAHQVDPIHGGGIGLAMEAGFIAGETAVKALEQKDFSAKKLGEYERGWRAEEDKKLGKRLLLRKVLEKLSDDDFNHIFGSLNGDDLGRVMDGDFKPVVSKVLLKRPSLLKVLSVLVG